MEFGIVKYADGKTFVRLGDRLFIMASINIIFRNKTKDKQYL